jgi:hypothetical protein
VLIPRAQNAWSPPPLPVTFVPLDVSERLGRLEQLVADLIDVLRSE